MTSIRGRSDCPRFWSRLTAASGRLAFDVGANGGVVARMLAENFEHVVAFEPCVESFGDLTTSRPSNVTAVQSAASGHDGTVLLDVSANAIRTGQLTTGQKLGWGERLEERRVPCLTLDRAANDWGVPDFVKIDTEGHELEVLKGAGALLEHNPTMAIEVHDCADLPAIVQALATYDTVHVMRHTLHPRLMDSWWNHFYVWAEN